MPFHDPPSGSRVILPIQYLRGIAALMVVWHHAQRQVPGIQTIFGTIFGTDFGPSGVDLFFVISGFIMVVTTAHSHLSPGVFLTRRAARIIPLYWFVTLLMVALALVVPQFFRTLQVTPITLLKSLLFIPHYSLSFPQEIYPLLVPGWSLNYEMYFYVMFALAMFLPMRWRLSALLAVLGGAALIGIVLGPFASAPARLYSSPLLLEFLAGAVIGHWHLQRYQPWSVGISLLMIMLGAVMLFERDARPLGYFNQIIGASLTVLGSLHPSFARWYNLALLELGNSSYSLYLTHLFVLGLLRVLWGKLFPGTVTLEGALLFMGASLLLCPLAAMITYRYVEAPLERALRSAHLIRASQPASGPVAG